MPPIQQTLSTESDSDDLDSPIQKGQTLSAQFERYAGKQGVAGSLNETLIERQLNAIRTRNERKCG
jgi:hypothetical protein